MPIKIEGYKYIRKVAIFWLFFDKKPFFAVVTPGVAWNRSPHSRSSAPSCIWAVGMIISKYDVPQDRTPDPELREFRGVRIPEIRK